MKDVHVVINKQSGFLSISPSFFSWKSTSTPTSTIEFPLHFISALHVNIVTADSAKFLLKISFKSHTEPLLLSFENEAIRTIIKDQLSQSMTKLVQTPLASLRAKLLAEDPLLAATYKELSGAISEDEFWSPYEKEIPYALLKEETETYQPITIPPFFATKKLSITPEIIQKILSTSSKVSELYNRLVHTTCKFDDKTFWTLFFQKEPNELTRLLDNTNLGSGRLNLLVPQLESIEFDIEDQDQISSSSSASNPLISAINRHSSLLVTGSIRQTSATTQPISSTQDSLQTLELKSPSDYLSKASGAHYFPTHSQHHLERAFTLPNILPSQVNPPLFESIDQVCVQLESFPLEQFSSFLYTREDFKFFHHKCIYLLKIFYHTPAPSVALCSFLQRSLELFRVMRSSFPPQVHTLGSALEAALTHVVSAAPESSSPNKRQHL